MAFNPKHFTGSAMRLIWFLYGIAMAAPCFAEKDRLAGTAGEKSGDEEVAKQLAHPRPAYTPLPGQIPLGVDDVTQTIVSLKSIADSVPAGAQGRDSAWFTKLQNLQAGVDHLAATKLQTDLFAQLPLLSEFLAAEGAATPEFVRKTADCLKDLISITIIQSIKQNLIEQNAIIPAERVRIFSNIFSVDGFGSEADWEDSSIPVDAAGVMILDAKTVVAHLKTQPWHHAKYFLGDNNAAEAFARYEKSGDGLGLLKEKYASNKPFFIAKWNELAGWVARQSAINP